MGLTRIRAQQITDIDYKQAVRVVTSENVTLDGEAPNQVDGVNLSTGNRILVNGQSNKAQNGLYQVETVGAGSNGTWIRTNDGNTDGEIDPGMLVMVTEGDTYADTLWKLVTNGTIVIGETELLFVLNTAFGFGNIAANGTSVIATVQNDTLSLTAGENITIIGNATSKTIEFSAVGGIPGGNTTEVQYNNAGIFSGSENFTFDGSNVDVTGNITANYFLGNGSQLSGIITSVANINNGTTNVSIDVVNGPVTVSIDGVGNVAVVDSTAITMAANLVPAANVTYDLGTSSKRWKDIYLSNSSIYLGNLVLSAADNTLLINNQSVITSAAGDSLILTGNITGGNIAGTNGTFTNVLGNGSALTGLNADNISSGTVSSDRLSGSYSISVTSANTAATVTTAAQPNITSVGTLTSLTVTGVATHTGNIDVTGNINVTGNLNYENVSDLVVGDPLIYIGADNTGNLFDLGLIVSWNDGVYQHGGWVRDASDGIWKLFGNVIAEPTTTVDFTDAIYQPMQAGAITATTGLFTGNVSTGNVSGTTGTFTNLSITGNVSADYFVGNANVQYTTSTAPPSSGNLIGAQWYNTSNDVLYEFQSDGTSEYWVDITTPVTIGQNAGNTVVFGSILPSIDITYNLGSPSYKWKDLYLGGNVSAGNISGTTGTFTGTVNAAGGVSGTPAFRAYMANAQTISATTFTKLNFNTEVFDTNSNYNTVDYRFTPTVAGYYQVSASTYFSATAQLYIYKNGSANITGAYVNSVGHVVGGLVYLNGTTDYIEIYYFGSAGITTSNNSEAANQFSAFLARAA